MKFSFPDSLGGSSYTIKPLENVKKGHDKERKNMEVTFLPQPILTNKLELSSLVFDTNRNWDPYRRYHIRFAMELFGCSDYQADTSKEKNDFSDHYCSCLRLRINKAPSM